MTIKFPKVKGEESAYECEAHGLRIEKDGSQWGLYRGSADDSRWETIELLPSKKHCIAKAERVVAEREAVIRAAGELPADDPAPAATDDTPKRRGRPKGSKNKVSAKKPGRRPGRKKKGKGDYLQYIIARKTLLSQVGDELASDDKAFFLKALEDFHGLKL
jgi:hypothetical protein